MLPEMRTCVIVGISKCKNLQKKIYHAWKGNIHTFPHAPYKMNWGWLKMSEGEPTSCNTNDITSNANDSQAEFH